MLKLFKNPRQKVKWVWMDEWLNDSMDDLSKPLDDLMNDDWIMNSVTNEWEIYGEKIQ